MVGGRSIASASALSTTACGLSIAFVGWIRRYILFHGKRHPAEMGAREIEAFLSHLATLANVAASTQNQALSAILFLYRDRPADHGVCPAASVKDIDFSRGEIVVRERKGAKDRVTVLPQNRNKPLQMQLDRVRVLSTGPASTCGCRAGRARWRPALHR